MLRKTLLDFTVKMNEYTLCIIFTVYDSNFRKTRCS
jgi:hypothetical protein